MKRPATQLLLLLGEDEKENRFSSISWHGRGVSLCVSECVCHRNPYMENETAKEKLRFCHRRTSHALVWEWVNERRMCVCVRVFFII